MRKTGGSQGNERDMEKRRSFLKLKRNLEIKFTTLAVGCPERRGEMRGNLKSIGKWCLAGRGLDRGEGSICQLEARLAMAMARRQQRRPPSQRM